ncbi:LOW QUALITY PROTEIN: hypothetical protein M514_22059, partial [Trichuris suis]
MNANIRNWVRTCVKCRRCKIHSHTVTPLSHFLKPDARFNKVHLDIVGPLPTSNGCKYILSQIQRWVEALPITDTSATTVTITFVRHWVSQYGVMSTVTIYRGTQFESDLWQHLMHTLGCQRICTTAYHPIANGIVERFHRQLKVAIKVSQCPTNWTEMLPLYTLNRKGRRTAAELVFGTSLRIPGEFCQPSQQSAIQLDPTNYVHQLKRIMRGIHHFPDRTVPNRKVYVPADLAKCSHVLVRHGALRKPFTPPYDAPIESSDLDINGKTEIVSLDLLNPGFLEPQDKSEKEI